MMWWFILFALVVGVGISLTMGVAFLADFIGAIMDASTDDD